MSSKHVKHQTQNRANAALIKPEVPPSEEVSGALGEKIRNKYSEISFSHFKWKLLALSYDRNLNNHGEICNRGESEFRWEGLFSRRKRPLEERAGRHIPVMFII